MPMPPPNPTTDGRSDPQTRHEVQQVVRALRAEGPIAPGDLEAALGPRAVRRGRRGARTPDSRRVARGLLTLPPRRPRGPQGAPTPGWRVSCVRVPVSADLRP
jgi:hypothetical protein